VEILKKMMQAGMNVARLNFSHGTYEEHEKRIKLVRQAAIEGGYNIALLLDTKGPEIRIGKFKEEPVTLKEGKKLVLTTEEILGDSEHIHITYSGLPADVEPGNTILIADGLIELKVLSTSKKEITCEIVNGGQLTGQKGVNVPGVKVNLSAMTEQDISDLKFGIKQNMDFIAASFVRKTSDVLAIREVLEEAGADLDIIAKIENREGVDNVSDIIKVADGIMVARGDLGVEIPAEEVPLLQKRIIEKCNRLGKPVITATQMLESMIQNPRPTRAEASDVANAIFDGTDAIMLSGETAIGKHPVEAVKTMARIAECSEQSLNYEEILSKKRQVQTRTVTDSISYATCAMAQDLGAAAIITATQTGYTSIMVSKYRPKAPVIAVTPVESISRKMALVWGVKSILTVPTKTTDEMISTAVNFTLAAGLIKSGDLLVITAGVPVGIHGTTNLIRVHTVGDILARGTGIGARAVTGKVRIVRTVKDAQENVQQGDILVAESTDRDYMPAIQKAGAIITEVGGLTSHAAIVGLQFGIPVIVGVDGAVGILPEGQIVTVDGRRGLIYSGEARVL
jgi:pyruvate kinase